MEEKEDLVVNNFIDMVGSKTRQCKEWWELMKVRMEYLMGVVGDGDGLMQRGGHSNSLITVNSEAIN